MPEHTPESSIERAAMNIVHQIGDALYDALPKDVAHEYFVTARQTTNDMAIDLTKKLMATLLANAKQEERQSLLVEIEGLLAPNSK